MFPTSTLQKNDHSIPLLTILTTCNPSHPTHLLESKWLYWASQKMINGEQSLCHQQHGISIPAQLQDTALPGFFPLYLASESSNLTSLRQPPLSSRSTQIDKLFMWYFSVLYLLTLIKEKKVSVHRVLALRQPVWHMFTLNSYRSPRKWALVLSSNREIVSLSQGHTNIT